MKKDLNIFYLFIKKQEIPKIGLQIRVLSKKLKFQKEIVQNLLSRLFKIFLADCLKSSQQIVQKPQFETLKNLSFNQTTQS
ncbi:unnamed protein product [Paramecium primaurelia]|uniref:Uncharacterized protein n=1 Tax=Paramecium primaurelia TaxID=5886 RepID=A0A8S1NYP4_PARPR|nr:unnamed protein product [Paramecium primaurelia]